MSEPNPRLARIFGEMSALFADACREMGGDPSLARKGPAKDHELDGQNGDPTVTQFAPRKWKGRWYANRHYSKCPSEFLRDIAGLLAWKAENPKKDKEQYAKYDHQNARLALGWAIRNEGLYLDDGQPEAPPSGPAPGDSFGGAPFSPPPFGGGDNPFETGDTGGPGPSNGSSASGNTDWSE